MIRTDDPLLMQNMKYYQWGHLAMTYASLSTLVTLGDDLSRIDRQDIVAGKWEYAEDYCRLEALKVYIEAIILIFYP